MSTRPHIERIISGGQTGADRATLDWAVSVGIPHGGWCPKGRKAEDGPIDARYQLQESTSPSYLQRTEWNVRDSDGTVILTVASILTGGSKRTAEFADKLRRPWIHLHEALGLDECASRLKAFIQERQVKALNIAGTRRSKEPNVGKFVAEVLTRSVSAEG